ncbi:MAG: transposase, partial [Thermoplasmata archaeon]
MRLRKAPYTEFKRISTSLDDFSPSGASPIFMLNNIPMMDLELKDHDLISYMNPMCPQCNSRNVVKNGTCNRKLENGITFRIQRYICQDCRYSFVARPPNYGYGKHYPDDVKEKSIRTRVKTSLRKTAGIFHTIGRVIISHETLRKTIPPVPSTMMEASGYFVYDEQYVHIAGIERYRALLRDSITGNFVEDILDDLREDTIAAFLTDALSGFIIPDNLDYIVITTDNYHYESILEAVSERINIRIKRQRCLFHIEKDLAHRIKDSHKEKDLDMAKRMTKFMFFQTERNLRNLGKNSEPIGKLIKGRNEKEIVDIMLEKITSLYGYDSIISNFLSFLKRYRKEVFLYLQDPMVEKTSDKAEQHFSIQSWLFKHRFKTKEGLLRTS